MNIQKGRMIVEITAENLINALVIAAGFGICVLCFIQVSDSTHLRKEVRNYFQLFFLLIISPKTCMHKDA